MDIENGIMDSQKKKKKKAGKGIGINSKMEAYIMEHLIFVSILDMDSSKFWISNIYLNFGYP